MFPPSYFPGFNRNYPRYSSYYNPYTNYRNRNNLKPISYTEKKESSKAEILDEKEINSTDHNNDSRNIDDSFFEIFGLKLYFDDILLICMIFFLYTEGVQDQMLFISLILLLLS